MTTIETDVLSIQCLKDSLPEDAYLSDLWKIPEKKPLILSVYQFGSSLLACRAYYRCQLEMDHQGTILAVRNDCDDRSDMVEALQHFVGRRVDLDSFKYDWERRVGDCPSSMARRQKILGLIRNGRYVPFTMRNAHQLDAMITPRCINFDDSVNEYDNLHLAQWFLDFVKQHREHLTSFHISHLHGVDYYYNFQIGERTVDLHLLQFFGYSLQATSTYKGKEVVVKEDKVLSSRMFKGT